MKAHSELGSPGRLLHEVYSELSSAKHDLPHACPVDTSDWQSAACQ